jgi:hypothetical protein
MGVEIEIIIYFHSFQSNTAVSSSHWKHPSPTKKKKKVDQEEELVPVAC